MLLDLQVKWDSSLVHVSGTKALCLLEDSQCAKEGQGWRSYPGEPLCSPSHSTQEMLASCKEAVTQEDLGAGSWKGPWVPADHRSWAHSSSQPQQWAVPVEEPTWRGKSLLALGQRSAQPSNAHVRHTGVMTLSEYFMLRVGKAVNILPVVVHTNA